MPKATAPKSKKLLALYQILYEYTSDGYPRLNDVGNLLKLEGRGISCRASQYL